MPLTTVDTTLDSLPAVARETHSTSRLVTRLEQLRKTLRPTPHVPLAVEGMNLFAKLEFVNPVGSIKDRPALWILKRAAERGEICDDTTVIEPPAGTSPPRPPPTLAWSACRSSRWST